MEREGLDTARGARLQQRLRNVASHRLFPLAAAALAIMLTLSSLSTGLFVDDYHHRLLMTDSQSPARLLKSPLDMFRFFDGDPERARQLKDVGVLPWWTTDDAKAAFWRPLTSLTHWLDYQLWPDAPALMHAQSILWYGLLVLVTALLYRHLAPTAGVAAVAALLFACDSVHAIPVGFLANRNAVIAATFGVLALIAHDRHRRGQSKPVLFGAVALLTASLLAAEAGIATLAYLGAYALCIDRADWKSRIVSMIPYLAVIVVWRLVWNRLGYGVEHLGVYVDPLGTPLRYLAAVKDRAPILLLAQFLGPPAELTMLLKPPATRVLWLAALIFLTLFAALLIPLLRRDRVARFWLVGTVLSILPVCATFPSDRLLTFTSIGAAGLLAQFLTATFASTQPCPGRRLHRIGAASLASLFILVHVIAAPLVLMHRAATPMGPRRFIHQMELGPLAPGVEQQDVIVVNPPLAFLAGTSAFIWANEGTPFPRRLRLLTSSLFEPVHVTRPDARTLVVRPRFGYYAWVFDALFHDPTQRFRIGQRVELAGMTVEVRQITPDGRPLEAAFVFPVPLEDPSLYWLQYTDSGFEAFAPPPVGQEMVLPAPPSPWRR